MWEKIFNVKKPFWQSMGTVFDLFLINILWVVCCIPIITIGPATTAVFYTLIQRARNEHTYLHTDFFRSFKRNFKQGAILGMLFLLVGGFLAGDMYLCRISGKGIYNFFFFFFGVFLLFIMMTALYAFPILAKFDRKIKEILVWAFTMSIKHILMTFMMLLTILIGLYMCHVLPGLLFIMFGLLFQYCATIMASIFKPLLPEPEYMKGDSKLYDFNPKSKDQDALEEDPWEAFAQAMDEDAAKKAAMDEAALYGLDPEELEKLMNEYE